MRLSFAASFVFRSAKASRRSFTLLVFIAARGDRRFSRSGFGIAVCQDLTHPRLRHRQKRRTFSERLKPFELNVHEVRS